MESCGHGSPEAGLCVRLKTMSDGNRSQARIYSRSPEWGNSNFLNQLTPVLGFDKKNENYLPLLNLTPHSPRKRGPLHSTIQLKPPSDSKRFRYTFTYPAHHQTNPPMLPYRAKNVQTRTRYSIQQTKESGITSSACEMLPCERYQLFTKMRPGDHTLAVRDRCIIRCLGLQRLHPAGRSSSPGPDREERQALVNRPVPSVLTWLPVENV
jgi:hypothetical protein